MRICRVLRTTPDDLIGFRTDNTSAETVIASAVSSLEAMEPELRETAAVMLRAMARHALAKAAPPTKRPIVVHK